MFKFINKINLDEVLDCYKKIESGIQWTDYGHKGRQAGVQYCPEENYWESAVGKNKGNGLVYTELNPYFKDTIFEDIIKQYNLHRTRLMWVGPYACYTMHKDDNPRIHVPIITNPSCYFLFKSGMLKYLEPGFVWWVDTRRHHTFINCSDQERLHLVGVVEK